MWSINNVIPLIVAHAQKNPLFFHAQHSGQNELKTSNQSDEKSTRIHDTPTTATLTAVAVRSLFDTF